LHYKKELIPCTKDRRREREREREREERKKLEL
jgi:hypothetical protein